MKFEEAVKKSIKKFLDGSVPEETDAQTEGGIYYTPDYFDAMEESLKETSDKE
jgi:hypothetical protein